MFAFGSLLGFQKSLVTMASNSLKREGNFFKIKFLYYMVQVQEFKF